MEVKLKLEQNVVQEIGELVKEEWFTNQKGEEFVSSVSRQITKDEGILMLQNFRDSITISAEQEDIISFINRLKELSSEHNRTEWHVRRQVLLQTARYFQDEHANGVINQLHEDEILPNVSDTDVETAFDVLMSNLIMKDEPSKTSVVNQITNETGMSQNASGEFVEYVGNCYSLDKKPKRVVQWLLLPASIDTVNSEQDNF